jgi:hypothetical protein
MHNKKEDKQNNNIFAFIYFILIFSVVIYLFMVLFGKNTIKNNNDLSIFDTISQGQEHKLIGNFSV